MHHFLDKEWIAAGPLDDETFERLQFGRIFQQGREQLFGILPAQRIKSELDVVALVAPLVPILRAIVHQQQDTSTSTAAGEQVEQRLGLSVDPVQVFEDHDYWLFQAFAKDDAL